MLAFKIYSKFPKLKRQTCICCFKRLASHLSSNGLPKFYASPAEEHILKKKFNDMVIWYEQLTGMDEVRIMQNRVIEAQDRFATAQEKRRNLSKEINNIQTKLKEIYSELDTTSRGEERYLQLITQEHAILKEERKLLSEFALVEREERDSFSALSSCVKDSHEKERAQAERTKYWSIIGSIIGTVIGIAGSSINNEFKMRELRKLVKDLTLRDSMKTTDPAAAKYQEAVIGKIDNLLQTIDVKHKKLLEKQVKEIKDLISSTQRYNGQLVTIPNDLETLIYKQSQETRWLLIGVSVVGVVIPILIAFLQK